MLMLQFNTVADRNALAMEEFVTLILIVEVCKVSGVEDNELMRTQAD